MSAPLVNRQQELLNGLFFRPEVAKQLGRVRREPCALFCDELLNGRITGTSVPFRYPPVFMGLLQ